MDKLQKQHKLVLSYFLRVCNLSSHIPTELVTLITNFSRVYTYSELKKLKHTFPKDTIEQYLLDDEFEKVFGLAKNEFYKLRPWKQKQLKKYHGLF